MSKPTKWSLKDKVALVTGASQGIGLYTARELMSLGGNVIAVARGADSLEKECSSTAQAHLVAGDATTEAGRQAIFAAVKKLGRLDILVNNVGTNIRKKLVEYSGDEIEFMIN